jgi:hypothetical protein
MMPLEDRVSQVVKLSATALAFVPLPSFLSGMEAALGDFCRIAIRASNPVWPTQLPNGFEALLVIEQGVYSDHQRPP